MSNSTSKCSLPKRSGSNSNRFKFFIPRNNKNIQQQNAAEPIKQDVSQVDLYKSISPVKQDVLQVVSNESISPIPISVKNLNNILSSFTPKLQTKSKGSKSSESVEKPYFVLENLWDSFKEWSAYGIDVPLTLNEDEHVIQYFVPYLSAIQLYVEDEGLAKKASEESGTSVPSNKTPHKLVYKYFEHVLPFARLPLTDQVSTLAKEDPCIKNLKSSELSSRSWFSVAWYPIYRIPLGPTMKNLSASFLTYHKLSTDFKIKTQPEMRGGKLIMSLPSFGLTTNKVKGSILPFPEASESRLLNSHLKAAADWSKNLEVNHYDHNHFVKNGKQWVE
ncbi:unnamed protein product [Lathyrus oleraceus]